MPDTRPEAENRSPARARGELCESAKKGFCCPDDLCRGADVTLCGFDKEFYESEIAQDLDDDWKEWDDWEDH